MSRHFPFQHPTFGTKNKPKPVSNWQDTVYYCWWEYLRRHEGYKKCCLRGGTGPFSRLYEDFGDVHTADFKSWWSEGSRCVDLFSEPKSEHHFRVLREPPTFDDLATEGLLFLKIPLKFPKRFLKQRFHEALEKYHQGRRGVQHSRKSRALYPVVGQPNIHALQLMLKIYDLKLAEPKMPMWQIAVRLRLFHLEQAEASTDEKNVATATVSRYLKKARALIDNVGKGRFPDFSSKKDATAAQPAITE